MHQVTGAKAYYPVRYCRCASLAVAGETWCALRRGGDRWFKRDGRPDPRANDRTYASAMTISLTSDSDSPLSISHSFSILVWLSWISTIRRYYTPSPSTPFYILTFFRLPQCRKSNENHGTCHAYHRAVMLHVRQMTRHAGALYTI